MTPQSLCPTTLLKHIMLAGAIGDAFGYQVEFDTIDTIKSRFGASGIDKFLLSKPIASDDTQMSIFCLAAVQECVSQSITKPSEIIALIEDYYLDWFLTQMGHYKNDAFSAYFTLTQNNPSLWARRAPGNTCLSALSHRQKQMIPTQHPTQELINDSYGCGAVMRCAPIVLLKEIGLSDEAVFSMAIEQGALTHGHAKGYLPSGVFLNFLMKAPELNFSQIIELSQNMLAPYPNSEDTIEGLNVLSKAMAEPQVLHFDALVERFGNGFDGLSALLIGVYCAYKGESLEASVMHASNHSGDSDSTAILAAELYAKLHPYCMMVEDFYQKYHNSIDLSQVIEKLIPEPPVVISGLKEST